MNDNGADHSDHLVLPWLGEASSLETQGSGFTRGDSTVRSHCCNHRNIPNPIFNIETSANQRERGKIVGFLRRNDEICFGRARLRFFHSTCFSGRNGIALHCILVCYITKYCIVILYCIALNCSVSILHWNVVLDCIALYSIWCLNIAMQWCLILAQYCSTLHCIALYLIVLHCIALVLHCIELYCTV